MRMRSIPAAALLVMFVSLPALAAGRGFELSVFGGLGSSRASGNSSYLAEWSAQALESLRAETAISAKASSGLTLGASLRYLFTPNFGLELAGGYFNPGVATTADFVFDWKLESQAAVHESHTWTGTGRLSSLPLSLNLVGRFAIGPVEVSASAGATLFLNSFNASSFAGLGASFIVVWWVWVDQFVDAFQVPLRIEETSWTALGGNVGLSAGIKLTGPLSLVLDGRYFLCPSKEFAWKWQAGTYTGLNNPNGYFSDWEFRDADLAESQAATTTLKVNPSYFSILGGLKLRF